MPKDKPYDVNKGTGSYPSGNPGGNTPRQVPIQKPPRLPTKAAV